MISLKYKLLNIKIINVTQSRKIKGFNINFNLILYFKLTKILCDIFEFWFEKGGSIEFLPNWFLTIYSDVKIFFTDIKQ